MATRKKFLEKVRSKLTAHRNQRVNRLLSEKARRRCEALRLYEPLPAALAFHKDPSPRRLARGSNRSSKTLTCAVEMAWAVCGTHPWHTYPATDGRVYVVAKEEKEIGEVLYRKLFRAGAFKMILDEPSGFWRTYRPWQDLARKQETKPAPPLIPPRMIAHRGIAWKNRRKNVPSLITLTNGWEISFFTAGGKPILGPDVDICWFDEEITDPDWLAEVFARLIDRRGRFMWSATPQAGTDQLLSLSELAAEDLENPKPSITEHLFRLADNAFLEQEDKDLFAAGLTEDEYKVRYEGEFAALGLLMYPNFSKATHIVPHEKLADIPPNWCRYMVIDPGNVVCAVLFAAVPPNERQVFLYDEIYLKHTDLESVAERIRMRSNGQTFYAFIIDDHGSARTEMGGKTIRQQFTEAFRVRNIKSEATGYGFRLGWDDVKAGCEIVRSWLRVREDGTPRLQVLADCAPNFEREIKHYRRRKDRETGELKDEPDQRRYSHAMDCLRYLAAVNPRYHRPKIETAGHLNNAQRRLESKRRKRRESREGTFVNLGPGR